MAYPDDDLNQPYSIPKGQQFGAMGDAGYFGGAPQLPSLPPQSGATVQNYGPDVAGGNVLGTPMQGPDVSAQFGQSRLAQAGRSIANTYAQHEQWRAGMFGQNPGGAPGAAVLDASGQVVPQVNISPAPRTGIAGNEPSGPLSGEGGMGMAGRGYPMGSVERAAATSGEGGLGMAGRGYGEDNLLRSSIVPPVNRVQSAVQPPGMPGSTDASNTAAAANLADIRARYGAMVAGEKMDEQQALARRDQSIREQIARADAYRGGINAFEEAGRQRVARINARGNEIFGPNFGAVRAQQEQAAQAANVRPGHTGAEARDFFKEAATTEDLAAKARKSVTDTAKEAREARQTETKLGLEARKVGVEERKGASDVQTAEGVRQTHEQQLEGLKQIANLRNEIAGMPEGPEKQGKIKELYASQGKAPPTGRFALAQVPFGEPDPTTGQRQLRHIVFDQESGQFHDPLSPAGGVAPTAGGAAPGAVPTPGNLKRLQANANNPAEVAQFEAVYGPGSAAKYLKK